MTQPSTALRAEKFLLTDLVYAESVRIRIQRNTRVLPDECHLWSGYTDCGGYGRIKVKGFGARIAHRVAYVLAIGEPISAGMQLDHTCHNRDASCEGGLQCLHRRCVNPEHLQPVTQQENMARGLLFDYRRSMTHCSQGHPFDDGNTHISNGRRRCRTCRAAEPRRIRPLPSSCERGHALNSDNVFVGPSGKRYCLICRAASVPRKKRKLKDTCKNGHEYTDENTFYAKGRSDRGCRACRAQSLRDLRARRRAVKGAAPLTS